MKLTIENSKLSNDPTKPVVIKIDDLLSDKDAKSQGKALAVFMTTFYEELVVSAPGLLDRLKAPLKALKQAIDNLTTHIEKN